MMRSEQLLYYLLIGFNAVTLLIFISNPFESLSGNHTLTVIYILLNILCVAWGYRRGLAKGYCLKAPASDSFLAGINNRAIKFIFIFYLATFLLKYAYEMHCPAFNISALVNRIIMGVMNPYLGYTTGGSYRPFGWSLYVIISIVDGIFFIIGMLCWRKMSKVQKYVFVVLSIIELFKGMGTGSSFGEIKLFTTLAIVVLSSIQSDYVNIKTLRRIILGVILIALLAVTVFTHNMEGRAGGEFSSMTAEHFNFNKESFINKYLIMQFSERIQNLYIYICHYLNNGYYNLEYIFNLNWDWTYFFGSNDAKSHLINVLGGVDVEPMNYQTKIYKTYGVDPYIFWHSCYVWLANDVSIFGVPIIMFWVGKFCSTALVLYRRYNDLLSGVIFVIFANMIIFLFANNNYIANLFYTFMFIFPIWIFTRYKKKI